MEVKRMNEIAKKNVKEILFKGIIKEFGGEKLVNKNGFLFSPTIFEFLEKLEIPVETELYEKYSVKEFTKENLFSRFFVSIWRRFQKKSHDLSRRNYPKCYQTFEQLVLFYLIQNLYKV